MKTKIYWSILHNVDDAFKDAEDFGMYSVMILLENPNTDFYLITFGDLLGRVFYTEHEALQYVKELQKPIYYDFFGNNYELVYMEPLSPEFVALMTEREKFMVELFGATIAYWEQPVWRRKLEDCINYLKKLCNVVKEWSWL